MFFQLGTIDKFVVAKLNLLKCFVAFEDVYHVVKKQFPCGSGCENNNNNNTHTHIHTKNKNKKKRKPTTSNAVFVQELHAIGGKTKALLSVYTIEGKNQKGVVVRPILPKTPSRIVS